MDVPGYAALILRRTYGDLALPGAIMSRAREWLYGKAHWHDKTYTFKFPSSATLTFGYCESEEDVYRYQGTEAQYIAFDELTQFSETQYEYLFSRLRGTSNIEVPLRMRAASNPGGVGHGWVRDRFIRKRKPGVIFIPAKLSDHPDKKFKEEYHKSLSHLPDTLRQQYEEGDWDVAVGLAFTGVERGVHVVPAFKIPEHWHRFESMDHGTAAPTAWILYCVDIDGNVVVSDLYYKANTLPDEDAAEVLKRRLQWWERKDDQGYVIRHSCYGDPSSIRERLVQRNDFGQPMTLQDLYEKHGVFIQPANNRRRIGYISIAQALKPDPQRRFPLWHPRAGEFGSPRLFFLEERTKELVDQLQSAPLAGENDPDCGEAVDAKWERGHGHAVASLRYGLTTFQNPSQEPEKDIPDDPEEIRRQYAKRLQARMRDSSAAKQKHQEEQELYW